MGHTAKRELRVLIEALAVKAIEKRSRSRAIETSIVEAEPYASHDETESASLSQMSGKIPRTKPLTMRCCSQKVKSKQRYESNGKRKQKAAPYIAGAALSFY
jgi:hypothetical protein